jgi:hypothetical protein
MNVTICTLEVPTRTNGDLDEEVAGTRISRGDLNGDYREKEASS